ncbi:MULTISPECIES: transposase [unclassified Candidatus Tisiphia]|uniref:transposase n=1 Tax=unclassified Candidatus Tisiphia TaxID=2996318 RepID=UPI00312CAD50
MTREKKKEPFSQSRKHSKYKIINWSEYNYFLRNRGRIDFMMASNLAEGWYDDQDKKRKRGRPRRYSDTAILRCLEIRCLFGLKLRQTQGLSERLCKYDVRVSPSLIDICPFLVSCVIYRPCYNRNVR